MCGLAGVIAPGQSLSRSVFVALEGELEHRGPDDHGYLSNGAGRVVATHELPVDSFGSFGLVHRRLSIIDLSPAGWQPMASANHDAFIAFNGEIYNYVELRRDLEATGHRFRTQSDTEVLLAAWQEWGERSLQRFVGMFAFAIVDEAARELVLVRDAAGIKPLYFALPNGGFAFASEINCLLRIPGVSRGVSPHAVRDYLQSGLTDHCSQTMFRDVQSVRPGELLRVGLDDGKIRSRHCWWTPQPVQRPPGDAATELRETLLESVRVHLRSDVPVGIALSGGIDSSVIACLARRVLGPDADIRAFSYFADGSASEESWIQQVATDVGARLVSTRIDPHQLVDELDELIRSQGEPFVTTSIYAQRRVFQLGADAGVKVMLSGQGADELFAGYPSLAPARIAELATSGQLGRAVALARSYGQLPGDLSTTWHLSRAIAAAMPERAVPTLRRLLGHRPGERWVRTAWFADRDAQWTLTTPRSGSLTDALTHLRESASLPQLLRYEDRNSMAFSIESRVPFLGLPVIELATSLPADTLLDRQGRTKAVLRDSMRGLVPQAVLERKDKVGFATPERDWLRVADPWLVDVLSSDAAKAIPALDAVELMTQRQQVGSKGFGLTSRLWRPINLIRWSQAFDVSWDVP